MSPLHRSHSRHCARGGVAQLGYDAERDALSCTVCSPAAGKSGEPECRLAVEQGLELQAMAILRAAKVADPPAAG